MTLRICGKTSDLFSATLVGNDGHQLGEDYSGYVPEWLPNPNAEHYGDYIQLDIDPFTGQIKNWRKPLGDDLAVTFKIKRGVKVGKSLTK